MVERLQYKGRREGRSEVWRKGRGQRNREETGNIQGWKGNKDNLGMKKEQRYRNEKELTTD